MANLFKRLPEGAGKAANKKQVQDFIKEVLFEKSLAELNDMVLTDYAGMPGAALAVIQAAAEAFKCGDFSRLKPMLDFAFEKDLRARK
jgi:hypothetical protein